jgi:hypothetical protein
MRSEGKADGQFFTATMRLELDSARAQITRMVVERMQGEMGALIEAAVAQAINKDQWHALVRDEVEKSTRDLIKSAVDDAVKYNYELKTFVQSKVMTLASEAIRERIGQGDN